MAQPTRTFYPRQRHLLVLVLIAAALYVLLPQIGDFRSSWQLLSHPRLSFTAGAVALTFATYIAAAGTYCFLAFKPLRFGRSVLVQLAAMFINRLVPAGIGTLGANYLYLRRERHTAPQAVSVAAANNLLGFVGHGLLILAVLLIFPVNALANSARYSIDQALLLEVLAGAAVILAVGAVVYGRRTLTVALRDVRKQLLGYRRRPWSLAAGLATSVTLTLCNVFCLICCLQALGLNLSLATVLLVFTFGAGTGAVVPTPGGLGGFEAGLAAGFVAYGLDPATALAAALLYRLVSYWLPLPVGLLAFAICQKQKLFGATAAQE
jgi:uncharacterized protein (TIRG00374 family)